MKTPSVLLVPVAAMLLAKVEAGLYTNGTTAANTTTVAITTTAAITTVTVDVYTTYCPSPTVVTQGNKTYTVTEETTLTITDCPCTSIKTIPSGTTGPHTTMSTLATTASFDHFVNKTTQVAPNTSSTVKGLSYSTSTTCEPVLTTVTISLFTTYCPQPTTLTYHDLTTYVSVPGTVVIPIITVTGTSATPRGSVSSTTGSVLATGTSSSTVPPPVYVASSTYGNPPKLSNPDSPGKPVSQSTPTTVADRPGKDNQVPSYVHPAEAPTSSPVSPNKPGEVIAYGGTPPSNNVPGSQGGNTPVKVDQADASAGPGPAPPVSGNPPASSTPLIEVGTVVPPKPTQTSLQVNHGEKVKYSLGLVLGLLIAVLL